MQPHMEKIPAVPQDSRNFFVEKGKEKTRPAGENRLTRVA